MATWVRTETATWHTDDGDEGLGIADNLDDHGFELFDKVTIMPTADADELLRLLGVLAADAVTDDDGRCWFCADLPGYEDEDEHAPGCDLEKARAFLAARTSEEKL